MPILDDVTQARRQHPARPAQPDHRRADATVAAKLEFYNPAELGQGPHRRRDRRRRGGAPVTLKPGGTIVEATSGNTGIALAMVGAARGYNVVLDDAGDDEQGAPGAAARLRRRADPHRPLRRDEGRRRQGRGDRRRARRRVLARQFANAANPEIHRQTTAEEIWKDTDGKVDIFVAGIGTGGTITGVGQVLKARKPERPDRRRRAGGVRRSSTAAPPARTRSRASAPTSSRRSSTPTIYDEVIDVNADDRRGVGPSGRHRGGPARRHLLRRRARRRRPGRRRARRTPARRSSSSSRRFGERYLSTILFEGLVD